MAAAIAGISLTASTGNISFNALGEVKKDVQVQIVKDGNWRHHSVISDPELLAPACQPSTLFRTPRSGPCAGLHLRPDSGRIDTGIWAVAHVARCSRRPVHVGRIHRDAGYQRHRQPAACHGRGNVHGRSSGYGDVPFVLPPVAGPPALRCPDCIDRVVHRHGGNLPTGIRALWSVLRGPPAATDLFRIRHESQVGGDRCDRYRGDLSGDIGLTARSI